MLFTAPAGRAESHGRGFWKVLRINVEHMKEGMQL